MKTVRISSKNVVEEFNIRSTVTSYASTHGTDIESISAPQKDYLAATDVRWSHSNYDTVIATAASNGRIVLYDIRRPEVELSRLHEHSRQVHRLAFSPFGAHLFLSASHDATTRLWDLRTLRGEKGTMSMNSIRSFQSRAEAARDVRWSPTDAYQFAMCTDAGIISLWDIRHPSKALNRLNAHEKACYALDWHPDGKHVVSAGLDRNVKVWEITNERRRQRPIQVIKAPQGVMNARWRPASWSSENQSAGEWQCTQLVTTYNQEDPRVHIWDLRRPHVPCLEIDQYYSPPTDMLWHSKDLIWTVGNEGMFTQTDVKFTPETAKQISPCPKLWLPNGSLVSFSESTKKQRESGFEELLDLPKEKASSEEKTGTSHSMTDDETISDTYIVSLKRRQGRTFWSQDSTPPSRDEPTSVLNLDQALEKDDDKQTQQVGLTVDLDMATLGVSAFRFLAERSVKPMTAYERRQSPHETLPRLEQAFNKNAEICDEVLLHQLAQSWKILGYVIIEDLRSRAEANREQRLTAKAKEKTTATDSSASGQSTQAPNTDLKDPNPDLRLDGSLLGENPKARGSNGISAASEKRTRMLDLDSTSNVTTPLAKPVPDTPTSDRSHVHRHFQSSGNNSETIPPLPPSLLHSHWAAAAASDALREDEPASSSSADSSPLLRRVQSHSNNGANDYNPSLDSRSNASETRKGHHAAADVQDGTNLPSPSLMPAIDTGLGHEGERRAALHEYRVQNRPILSFEPTLDNLQPDHPNLVYRHDSNESFPMFSASTDSSTKIRSTGGSFESAGLAQIHDSSANQISRSSLRSSLGSLEPSPRHQIYIPADSVSHDLTYSNSSATGEQTPPTLPFSLEGFGDTRIAPEDCGQGSLTAEYGTKSNSLSTSVEESSPEQMHRPQPHLVSGNSNPPLNESIPSKPRMTPPFGKGIHPLADIDEFSPDFIHTDFENLQPVEHSPKNLFPWSPLRLLVSCLEADARGHNGSIYCQFAAQILFHVLPFYFPKATDATVLSEPIENVSSAIFHSLVRSIFSTYLDALKVHSLFVLATEVQVFCKEYDLQSVYAEPSDEEEGSKDNGLFVFAACRYCSEPLGGRNSGAQCLVCGNIRDPCPLCLDVESTVSASDWPKLGAGGKDLWTFCQGCGHGGHVACMTEWLGFPDSEGCCPTPFCGHDCGPGPVRDRRIEGFLKFEAEASLIRGSNTQSGAKTDSWVVPQSAAVGQTRAVLSGRSGSGGSGGKKQVRLVTPSEQSLP